MDMFTLWPSSTDEDEASECELEKLVTPEACIDLSGTYLRSPGGRLVTFIQDGDSGRADWEGNSFSYTVSGATVVNQQEASQRGKISGQQGSFTITWSHGATYTQQAAGISAPASIWEVLSAELFATSVAKDGHASDKADRFFAGSPRNLAKGVGFGSGWDIFSSMQLFSTCSGVQQIEPKVDPWQFERAAAAMSAFCSAHSTLRVQPSREELLDVWQICTPLHETAVADAFVQQIFGDGGECDWQPRLRVLCAMEFFASQGGYGREAAIAAARETEDLLQYLVAEVPECCQVATAILRLSSGEQAETSALAEELPRLGPALAPLPTSKPAEDLSPEPAGLEWVSDPAPGPRMEEEMVASVSVPDAVLDSATYEAWHPAAKPMQASLAWEAEWDQVEKLAPNLDPELPALRDEPPQPQPGLGYHWLDKSMVESLSFERTQDAFGHLDVHLEELKRHIVVH